MPEVVPSQLSELIAAEISRATRYYDSVIQLLPLAHDRVGLLDAIDAPRRDLVRDVDELPSFADRPHNRSAILLNGNLNYTTDIQKLLSRVATKMGRRTRLCVVAYNPYLQWGYRLAGALGWRDGAPPETFLTTASLHNLCRLAGVQIVRVRPVGLMPFSSPRPASMLINGDATTLPVARWLTVAWVVFLRRPMPEPGLPPLSLVVPARNEQGNIERLLDRLDPLDGGLHEVVFVEGHSTDGTWETIQRVSARDDLPFRVRALKQTGTGKNDAVRLGFAEATGELLAILDADMTVEPELLGRFYHAYCQGLGDFINGSRLVYPLEDQAMRFLNRLANVSFAKLLSYVLDTPLSDSLCGTKLLARSDYQRILRWRRDFGDFDPFGDFELLFPAAQLAMGIEDLPVHYRARTYGQTNISRFRHGAELLRMAFVGHRRMKRGSC